MTASRGRPEPDGAAGLERWAARRAPELIARAEAEAVAMLRDALVAASLGESPVPRRDPGPAREARPAAPPPAEAPDLLWAYCVLRDEGQIRIDTPGVAERGVQRVAAGGLAALVSPVPAAEFAQEPLTRNLNELAWLEHVARAHEAVLDAALAQSTVVPLRMCTIFESEHGVRELLQRRHRSLSEALDALEGRFEWAVKVLVDRDRLIDAAGSRHDDAGDAGAAAGTGGGEGGAYLRRRRDERGAHDAAGRLAAETAEQIHARLQDWALAAHLGRPQNRELSGHEGEMVLNAAYLVERERTEELRAIVAELEEHHRALGARIELSGPWPPYNFVPGEDAATAA